MYDMRSHIGDLHGQVVCDCTLDCQIPLLDVSGSGPAVNGVYALAESGVGREWNRRDRGAARQNERWPQAVLGSLLYALDEGKLRCRKRCRDSRLIDKDDAETGTHHRFGR